MKLISTLIMFFCTCSLSFSQNRIDLNEIKKTVQDTSSIYFYDKIISEFNSNPLNIDTTVLKYIYYGKYYTKYNSSEIDLDYIDCIENTHKMKYKEAILSGERLIKKDPTNINLIGYLIECYDQIGDNSEKRKLYGDQMRTLINCVKYYGNGTKSAPYIVNSVGDEFFMCRILVEKYKKCKRESELLKDGVLDILIRNEKKSYFKVLYNTEIYK